MILAVYEFVRESFWTHDIWHPLYGQGYQFWSGIMGATAIFSGIWIISRKHNCHERWCPRVGRFPVEGTPYITCHKHHPGMAGDKVQRGHIHLAHLRHKEKHT